MKVFGRTQFTELTIIENANIPGNKQMCVSGVDKRRGGYV